MNAKAVRVGFATEDAAYQAAVRRGMYGCTDGGQECCPIQLSDGSWGYWTAHNYFRPERDPGRLVLPRRVIDADAPDQGEVIEAFQAENGLRGGE